MAASLRATRQKTTNEKAESQDALTMWAGIHHFLLHASNRLFADR